MDSSVRCAVVLPFLNEKDMLLATCSSLGFQGRVSPNDAVLFLVDNGSDDGSEVLAAELERQSVPGVIHHIRVQERGHAPARAKGNAAVISWAQSNRMAPRDVLILQADADTEYSPGYVGTMLAAAIDAPADALIEALVGYPSSFVSAQASYFDAVAASESAPESIYGPEDQDCLVDDKAAGYRLEAYLSWGGHRREYHGGEEVLAETTRLYIAARTRGSIRVRVDGARVAHSPRKLLAEPSLHTATAGFPRGNLWRAKWLRAQEEPTQPGGFFGIGPREWARALNERRKHLIALLGVLPEQMRRAVTQVEPWTRVGRFVASRLPKRSCSELFTAPSLAITDALTCVDEFGEELLALID